MNRDVFHLSVVSDIILMNSKSLYRPRLGLERKCVWVWIEKKGDGIVHVDCVKKS